MVGGARVGEFLFIVPPHGAADAPQRPDVDARHWRRASGRLAAHRAYPGVDLQRQRAGRGVRTVADVVGRFDRPPLRIVYLDAHRPQPFDEYLGHARSVAVPGALQVPEGGLDIARRQALVQTPLPGALLLVAGERRPAGPVVRVVLEPDAARRRHRRLRVVRQVEVGPVAPHPAARRPPPRPRPSRPGAGTTPRRRSARRRRAAGFRSRPRRTTSPRGRRAARAGQRAEPSANRRAAPATSRGTNGHRRGC